MKVTYPIAVIHDGNPNTAYAIAVPDFDNTCCTVVSAADTMEEIKSMVTEALELAFEEFLAQGEKVPMPRKLDDLINFPEYAGWLWTKVEVEVPQELL